MKEKGQYYVLKEKAVPEVLLKVVEAKRLIESGMSVSAAALSCGFENMSYFSRTYKKYTGTLPSSVRGRGRKNGAAGK